MLVVIIAIIAILIICYYFLRYKPGKADLSILPEHFFVVDIETTGLDVEKDEIIELGVVKVSRDSNVHTAFSALIKPEKEVSKTITEITGITNVMLEQEGEKLKDVMYEFLNFVGNSRLVVFNAPFDTNCISFFLFPDKPPLNSAIASSVKIGVWKR